ncbi:MAG: cyclic nucleotide-binding domain-containing protein [Oscillatoriales cyanobacterium RM2_1_1]|nr:cyclic nucleotide-binding domain-containing protein [Oscillatoriales cyanobacterium SM2_3_0]NJO46588.1 cyclic nucleotide-binding domain-containing protein [Oscillatoriales cyanobacterium RM2_1_1]
MLTPVETVQILQQHGSEPITISAGETIFTEGDPGELMYGLIEGEIQFSLGGKPAESIGTGDVFGEGALVNSDHKRRSTATAKTDCKLVTLDKERFLFAVQQSPVFALEVLRSYSDRVNTLRHLLVSE